jgi:hypothetical protein
MIGKKPLSTIPGTCLEFCEGTILSFFVGVSASLFDYHPISGRWEDRGYFHFVVCQHIATSSMIFEGEGFVLKPRSNNRLVDGCSII